MSNKIRKILTDRTEKGVWVGTYADDKPVVTIMGVQEDAIKVGKTYGIRIKSKTKDMEKDNAGMGQSEPVRDTGNTSRGTSED